MLDFSAWLDLPLIWAFLIAAAVFLYVWLDGFDVGCGILFPFAPSDRCRTKIMNSIAPFWDGNETWLVLGGGGLLAAFPLAYAVIMPALYIPIILMLIGLVFRGVAFEFRFKTYGKDRRIWDHSFHWGSLLAAFMQGVILGNIVQGIEVEGRSFVGGPLDWANGFSIFTGMALIFGYALLASTWLIMKTEGETQRWARQVARYVLFFVAFAMIIVSICMPLIDRRVSELWFSKPNIYYLSIIPGFSVFIFGMLWTDLKNKREMRPFFLAMVIFFLSYLGLGISLFPWIVPFSFTIWQAAATSTSLSLLLVGTIVLLPIILTYTAYSYYVFRGKTSDAPLY